MSVEFPIPNKSAIAWKKFQDRTAEATNPGLIFHRFVQYWGDSDNKKAVWDEVAEATKRMDGELLQQLNQRWRRSVAAANARTFTLETEWRLVAGLGGGGPLEVGFTFDRYGFPILPGSSLKGVCRTWALVELIERLQADSLGELDELLSLESEKEFRKRLSKYRNAMKGARAQTAMARDIFGTTGIAGGAVFFDAIPSHLPHVELDIMNPHFPDYYQNEGQPATNWQNPSPVYFLTLTPNTTFRFAIGWRGAIDKKGRFLQKRAETWLTKGLKMLGVGAKTSAGYGYFQSSET